MELAEIHAALKKCDVLATADDDSLHWLAEAAETEFYEADQVVFSAGDVSSQVYVVAWGSLQVLIGESARLVSFAEAGGLFGEYAMFVKGVRTAHVVAAEATVLLAFKEETFRKFLLRLLFGSDKLGLHFLSGTGPDDQQICPLPALQYWINQQLSGTVLSQVRLLPKDLSSYVAVQRRHWLQQQGYPVWVRWIIYLLLFRSDYRQSYSMRTHW